jgi:hypothetical protein
VLRPSEGAIALPGGVTAAGAGDRIVMLARDPYGGQVTSAEFLATAGQMTCVIADGNDNLVGLQYMAPPVPAELRSAEEQAVGVRIPVTRLVPRTRFKLSGTVTAMMRLRTLGTAPRAIVCYATQEGELGTVQALSAAEHRLMRFATTAAAGEAEVTAGAQPETDRAGRVSATCYLDGAVAVDMAAIGDLVGHLSRPEQDAAMQRAGTSLAKFSAAVARAREDGVSTLF